MKEISYKILLSVIVATLFLTGCNDDLKFTGSGELPKDDELPVEFLFSRPSWVDSRAEINASGNEKFTEGDVIHVLATFTTRSLQPDGKYQIGEMKRYGALRYNGIIWESLPDSKLTWPSIATSATFIAYYLSESTGLLTGENDYTLQSSLSDLTASTDPLYGESDPDNPVPYGNAVQVNFRHICAHLTLVNLEPNVSDQYWFTVPDNILKSGNPNDPTTTQFYNAFRISLGTDAKNQPTLNFEFFQEENPDYNLVYIAGHPTVIDPPESDPLAPPTMNLEYFLYPGYYDVFDLVYPVSTTATYPYLQYNYNNIPDYSGSSSTESKIPPLLQSNTPYTLNITKAPGVTMTTPTTEDGWDENGDFFYIVDVEEFLKAATSGDAYEEKGTQILEKTFNGCRLLKNVDFHKFDYNAFKDQGFIPDNPENNEFDGGLHYIKNIAWPVFHDNSGTIRNLGIKNPEKVVMQIQSYEVSDPKLDNSLNGALCHINTDKGTLNNIRLSDIMMNVEVKSDGIPGSNISGGVHSIGGLAGENYGVISKVEMGGTFSINVTGYSGNQNGVNSIVLIGGVVGQNAGGSSLTDVATIENKLFINITNSCVGDLGNYAVGGIVGQSGADISGVFIPSVNIDCSQSKGVTSYLGGMVGNLSTEDNSPTGLLTSCNVGGSVTAGETAPYDRLTSGSYIGGIGGVVFNMAVIDCNSSVSVTGSASENADVIYATGGGFGRVRKSSTYALQKLVCYGGTLNGPEDFIGDFIGIAPNDEAWTEWEANLNAWQIIVKDFDYEFIGTTMD